MIGFSRFRVFSVVPFPENARPSFFAFADVAAEFFLIREAVLIQLLPGPLIQDPALVTEAWDQWSTAAAEMAEIDVASQIGVWDGPATGILPPPSG